MKYTLLLLLSAIIMTASAQNRTDIYPMGDRTRGNTDSFTYAVIGDYGNDSKGEQDVADMVIKSWKPAFIITTGDNDYEDKQVDRSKKNIDTFITKYYSSYMSKKLENNRFFPGLGNHDQSEEKIETDYLKLFPFLNNAENYDFTWGPIHFYSLNSGPEGNCIMNDTMLASAKKKLDADTAAGKFRIVFFHHPLYSSALGDKMGNCNVQGKGIDIILNGHIHYYERMKDTTKHIDYITIGNSGRNDSGCPPAEKNKMAGIKNIVCGPCLGHQNGALKVTVVKTSKGHTPAHWRMTFEYYDVSHPQSPADVITVTK